MSDLDDLERRLFSEARREAPASDLAQRVLERTARLRAEPSLEASGVLGWSLLERGRGPDRPP